MNEINTLEISERTKSFSSTNSYITLPRQTYRILSHWIIYVLAITFIVIAFTFLGFGIKDIVEGDDIEIHNFIIFVVLVIISCLITYFFPFYTSITIINNFDSLFSFFVSYTLAFLFPIIFVNIRYFFFFNIWQ